MTGTHINVSVEMAEVRAMLDRLGQDDTADLMPRLGEYLLKSTQGRFKDQKAPDGTPWAKLSPAYARRKKYNKDKVLTLRGYLRSNVRYQVTGPAEVEVGSNSEYAAIHQLGGTIQIGARQATVRYRSVAGRVLFAGKKHKRVTQRQVTIPAHQVTIDARPFLGVSTEDDRNIREIVADWSMERTKG